MEILGFTTIPANSFLIIPEEARASYIQAIIPLHAKIRDVLYSTDTGAFVRGTAKTYTLAPEDAPKIAFAILEIAIGKKTFAQLPAVLSSELQLPMDKAQKMAGEIEKDLFGPVRNELNAFLQSQKSGVTSPNKIPPTKPMANMRNVLDLKEITPKPKQPQLPPKPSSPSLPSAQKPSLQPKPPVPPKRPPGVPITPIHFS